MEPWEVINSYGNGPYAVRILLGWVVNGTLEGNGDHKNEAGHSVVTVNRISVTKLEEEKFSVPSEKCLMGAMLICLF